jgi:hypothetical protein
MNGNGKNFQIFDYILQFLLLVKIMSFKITTEMLTLKHENVGQHEI